MLNKIKSSVIGKSKPCTPAQQFQDSVNIQQCKDEAFEKLSKVQVPFSESLHYKIGQFDIHLQFKSLEKKYN